MVTQHFVDDHPHAGEDDAGVFPVIMKRYSLASLMAIPDFFPTPWTMVVQRGHIEQLCYEVSPGPIMMPEKDVLITARGIQHMVGEDGGAIFISDHTD